MTEEEYQARMTEFRRAERLERILRVAENLTFLVIGATAMWIVLTWLA